jgi:hypothetical protein
MALSIGIQKDKLQGVFEYSFPIELVSSTPVDREPDYQYEWIQEGDISDEELIERWNSVKGDTTLTVKELYTLKSREISPAINYDIDDFFIHDPSEYLDHLVNVFREILNISHLNTDQKIYALGSMIERLHLLV